MKNRYWLILFISIIYLGYFSILFSNNETLNIFGHKTNSIFDLWSIQHLLAGVVISYLISKAKYLNSSLNALIFSALVISFSWEALELLMELGFLGEWLFQWKAGVEFWGNRMLIDPILVLLGTLLYVKSKKVFLPSFVFSALFLSINLILPDAVYLQEVILGL